jgi:hypothetical protein
MRLEGGAATRWGRTAPARYRPYRWPPWAASGATCGGWPHSDARSMGALRVLQ